MTYKLYSTEDFIQDDFFQQWVFSPNEERIHYWSTFLLHYPGQQEKIDEAREFLLAMNFERTVPESVIQRIQYNFNTAINQFESAQDQTVKHASGLFVKRSAKTAFFKIAYPIAASLLLVAVLIGYFVIQIDIPMKVFQTFTLEEQKTPQGKQ